MIFQIAFGALFAALWLIYLGQVVSVVNLDLARRFMLQERAEDIDAQYQRDTGYTARWDVLSMWVLPLAGTLMLLNHATWPHFAIIGGALYLDTGARQFLKLGALREEGVRVGQPADVQLAYSVYVAFIVMGPMGIAAGLAG